MSNIGHNHPTVTINSLSASDRDKVKKAISEMNDSMTRAMAERSLQKEIVDKLFDDIGVDKKIIKRMAKAYFRADFNEEVEGNNQFEEFYNVILKSQ